MARQDEDHSYTRPRMLYGDDSPTVNIPDRDSHHNQQIATGPSGSGPTQSRAILVRSYSRKLRSPQTQRSMEMLPHWESVADSAIPSIVQRSDSVVGGQGDGSVRGRQLDSSIRSRQPDNSVRDRQGDSSVRDRQGDSSVRDRQRDSNISDRQGGSVVERNFNESVIDREVDSNIAVVRQLKENIETVDQSFIERKSDERVVTSTFDESTVDRNTYRSVMDRNYYSSALERMLSGSVVDGQPVRSPVKRKPNDSNIGRKSAASHGVGKFVDNGGNRKFTESIIGRKSSRYSSKLTPVDQRRKSSTVKPESRNQTNKSRKSRLMDCLLSRLDDISRSTFCYNRDIVDENLLISAAKLDSTLIRLFSHARENHGENTDEQDPGTALMPFLNYSQSDLINMDAVMWRVFPMDAAQRETLDQELPFIEENLTSDSVMKHLYDKSILTHMDYNQLIRTEGQGEKAVTRLMVRTLQRRGDKAYPVFLDALQAHSYLHICQRLLETERCLREAMAADRSDSGNRSKVDHVSMHRHLSGKISQMIDPRMAEVHETLAPPTFISSANHVSRFDNDTQLTNHIPEQVSVGGAYTVKRETVLEEIPSCDLQVVDSKQLERQLLELMEEFESLQREVIAMKSAPFPQGSVDTNSNTDEVGPEQPEGHFATREVSSSDTESIVSNHPECYIHDAPEPSSRKGAQKSTSCSVL